MARINEDKVSFDLLLLGQTSQRHIISPKMWPIQNTFCSIISQSSESLQNVANIFFCSGQVKIKSQKMTMERHR
jgi:hypothetical protein